MSKRLCVYISLRMDSRYAYHMLVLSAEDWLLYMTIRATKNKTWEWVISKVICGAVTNLQGYLINNHERDLFYSLS